MNPDQIIGSRPDATLTARPADEIRAHLHRMWGSVAPGWSQNAEFADARGAAVTDRMLELVDLRPGDRVLELACGPGGVGLATAQRLSPDGEVILSDVAAEMTAIAATRAAARGLRNVRTRELDLEALEEPDGCYDAVLCREGIMLVLDPVRAASEIRRVLRPGGRVSLTVWGSRARNPWLAIVFDTVSAQLGRAVPPPGRPGPFSLDHPDRLEEILSQGGLANIDISELSTPYHADSVDEWWTRTAALAGPLAQILGTLPQTAAEELRARAHEAVSTYETPTGVTFPGVCLIARATRVD
jgi:ubiquinone/menaquinone biosynthesis C-methylase UbiE